MKKAQEVRSRRLESLKNELNVEAEKIFDWLLDLMDEKTKKGEYEAIEVYSFYDGDEIRCTYGKTYNLSKLLKKYSITQVFFKLEEVVEREEGFVATLDFKATKWDSKAITLKVSIT